MSEENYEQVGKFIYSALRYGCKNAEMVNFLADTVGLPHIADGDANPDAAGPVLMAFMERYPTEEAREEQFTRILDQIKQRGAQD